MEFTCLVNGQSQIKFGQSMILLGPATHVNLIFYIFGLSTHINLFIFLILFSHTGKKEKKHLSRKEDQKKKQSPSSLTENSVAFSIKPPSKHKQNKTKKQLTCVALCTLHSAFCNSLCLINQIKHVRERNVNSLLLIS